MKKHVKSLLLFLYLGFFFSVSLAIVEEFIFKQANKLLVVTTPKHFNPVDLSQISDHSDLLYHLSFPNFLLASLRLFFNPKAFIWFYPSSPGYSIDAFFTRSFINYDHHLLLICQGWTCFLPVDVQPVITRGKCTNYHQVISLILDIVYCSLYYCPIRLF